MNANNCLNGIFPSFNFLNSEFSSSFRLIDSCFSFHWANYKDKESKTAHLHKINNIFTNISLDPKSIIVVSDTSIRNNITMSILHVYSCSNNVKKTIHYTVNVTSTEVELFAIRCGINQAIHIPDINHIIIITNAIHLVQYIFDECFSTNTWWIPLNSGIVKINSPIMSQLTKIQRNPT